jgi:lysyl-tRNA synthetase class 2
MPDPQPANAPVAPALSQNEYREQRLAHLKQLAELGYKPFGEAFARTGRLSELRAEFAEGRRVSAAGRIMSTRDMGKTVFADLRDGSGRLQLFLNKGVLGDDAFAATKLLDLGDHIGVEGELFTTRTGEQSVRVERWTLLSKAILQPPEKYHGLQDTEERYRKRYLDLIANPEVRARFDVRIGVVREIRTFLQARGFQEVETPMMQPQAGGAAARPFVTHYNALDCDMYMRVAPELYLKRLLVAGFDKVFELNRNFRNEGLDRTHNPEFTVLELYEAYGDRSSMKAIIEGLLPHLCLTVLGSMTVEYGEAKEVIDFTPPYREVTYHDVVREHLGPDWFDLDVPAARAKAEALGVAVDPAWNPLLITHEVYGKVIERTLRQPTFVTRVPRQFVPLAKTCPDNPDLVDVFEFVVGGKELCPGYTEQNDPIAQRRAFEDQAGEDVEKIDEDFVTALEHGMPPAGGLGLGIDRLTMLLTGTEAIRDVILFPQLKPRS